MARKRPVQSRRGQRALEQRFNGMSSDELSERWRTMRSRYVKWLGLFTLLAAIVWLINHSLVMQHSAQELATDNVYSKVIGGLNMAFQISCVFWFLFAMLTAMSFIYGRSSRVAA